MKARTKTLRGTSMIQLICLLLSSCMNSSEEKKKNMYNDATSNYDSERIVCPLDGSLCHNAVSNGTTSCS